MKIYIQGDVILKTCDKIKPEKILDTDLLHKGEQHHHRIKGKFKIGETNGVRYVHSKGCHLFHEEHSDIFLPEGFYELHICLEYDHIKEESRKVID